jgi:hypothetical protein
MSRPRFKMRKTEDPGQDPHWQDVTIPTSWQHLRPVPYKRDPPDKSPPRTTSLCLAQQVPTSHEKSPPRTKSLCLARAPPSSDWSVGHDTRHELGARAPPPKRVGDRFPVPCKYTSWLSCKQLAPTRVLMRVCPVAQPSHQHHLPLCHTQAQPEALKHPLRQQQTTHAG